MSILTEIIAHKRDLYDELQRSITPALMRDEAEAALPVRDFNAALQSGVSIIAEIKRGSPSKGNMRPQLDPALLAREYEAGGASALSVLTDERYFGMKPEELVLARDAVSTPVLRKDFIVDEYMVAHSRVLGADAILLIVAALDDSQLADLYACAASYSMDVLVEVHDRAELERALAINPAIIGINSRNLHDYTVDLSLVPNLKRDIPDEITVVAESGIHIRADIEMLLGHGINAFLIGEALVRSSDPKLLLGEMISAKANKG